MTWFLISIILPTKFQESTTLSHPFSTWLTTMTTLVTNHRAWFGPIRLALYRPITALGTFGLLHSPSHSGSVPLNIRARILWTLQSESGLRACSAVNLESCIYPWISPVSPLLQLNHESPPDSPLWQLNHESPLDLYPGIAPDLVASI